MTSTAISTDCSDGIIKKTQALLECGGETRVGRDGARVDLDSNG
jgi:hypothetical protein